MDLVHSYDLAECQEFVVDVCSERGVGTLCIDTVRCLRLKFPHNRKGSYPSVGLHRDPWLLRRSPAFNP